MTLRWGRLREERMWTLSVVFLISGDTQCHALYVIYCFPFTLMFSTTETEYVHYMLLNSHLSFDLVVNACLCFGSNISVGTKLVVH